VAVLALHCREHVEANRVVAGMRDALRHTTAVRYDFVLEPTGSMRPEVRAMRGTVTTSIPAPHARQTLRIDATRGPLPGENAPADRFVLTSDGDNVTLRSDANRTLAYSPMHRVGHLILSGRVSRVITPFDARFSAGLFHVTGVAELDGATCDVIEARSADGNERIELAVSRADHLPRRLVFRTLIDGKPGATELTITKLAALDRFDSNLLVLAVPPGYVRHEATVGGPPAGVAAPEWTLDSAAGPISLASLRGKAVILDFWATWCGPCRASVPVVKRLYDTYHDRGLEVVGATWNEHGDPDAFAKAAGMRYPHVKGDSIGQAYGVDHSGIPAIFVIDRRGVVADFFAGWGGDETARQLETDVEQLLRN
jgi:thiol-disulfide isomerase/thioredoxin